MARAGAGELARRRRLPVGEAARLETAASSQGGGDEQVREEAGGGRLGQAAATRWARGARSGPRRAGRGVGGERGWQR